MTIMGDDITSMDIPGTATVAAEITNSAGTLIAAYQDLADAIQQTAGCWGPDKGGQQFAAQYLPNVEKFTSSVTSFNSQLSHQAEQISQLPREFEQADMDNSAGVESAY